MENSSTTEKENITPQVLIWSDKYERLLHNFNAVQKLNQELEDRLLQVIEKSESDKINLSHEIDDLNSRLQTTNQKVWKLEEESARYRSDCMFAVHLLECQPSGYISQRLQKVSSHVANQLNTNSSLHKASSHSSFSPTSQNKSIVHMPSFPPTAMVFHQQAEQVDNQAHILQDSLQCNIDMSEPVDDSSKDGIGVPTREGSSDSEEETGLHMDAATGLNPVTFINHISASPKYRRCRLSTCPKCGYSVSREDFSSQTDESYVAMTTPMTSRLCGGGVSINLSRDELYSSPSPNPIRALRVNPAGEISADLLTLKESYAQEISSPTGIKKVMSERLMYDPDRIVDSSYASNKAFIPQASVEHYSTVGNIIDFETEGANSDVTGNFGSTTYASVGGGEEVLVMPTASLVSDEMMNELMRSSLGPRIHRSSVRTFSGDSCTSTETGI